MTMIGKMNATVRIIALSALLLAATNSRALAQKTEPDFSRELMKGANCVPSKDSQYAYFRRQESSLSMSRLYQKSDFYFRISRGHSIVLACSINPQDFSILNFGMGVADGADSNTIVNVDIWQGGNKFRSYSLTPGNSFSISLDLGGGSNASNIAIEATCEQGDHNRRCWLYELNSELLPTPDKTAGTAQSSTSTIKYPEQPRSTSTPEKKDSSFSLKDLFEWVTR